ncbi:alpha-glucosidase [Jannaschia sp. 2305UL9-9]|uniref:glycoside hydrolase family 13 protein n=1 Tax=Jannaschia sp. 2305UL9-9 TaxID=3121638 RepID=UPI003528CABE
MTAPWWHGATGYQVYPRSFCDSNGDGIGDIPGITSRLDHLAALGVGFVWLSPVYASPMADMGYDISDYRAIAPEFGTLDDFDHLVAEAARRDIRIVMDLVVNHTSDDHAWFHNALAGGDRRDFYIWRDPAPDGGPPNAMQSVFGGPAWTRDPASGQYYFHQFTAQQPDLNWDNPAMRAEITDMMTWWLDRGIGGFRLDVIDLIGKDVDRGITTDGPDLHRHIAEIAQTWAGRDVLTVGEAWSVTPETAPLYCENLSMVFQFAHVIAGWHPEHGKWHPLPRDWPALKRVLFEWQASDCWNSLFWGNHDLPRAVSAYGSRRHRVASARALATVLHLMRGTPFIYQGEEVGMKNAAFSDLGQFRDVETLNLHRIRMAAGEDEATFIAGANANGRDTSRTPVHWDAGPSGGFTTGTPWITLGADPAEVNVAADRADPMGVFARYSTLTRLRRKHAIIREGDFTGLSVDDRQVMAYTRTLRGQVLAVVANLSDDPVTYDPPADLHAATHPLFDGEAPVDLSRPSRSGHGSPSFSCPVPDTSPMADVQL